MNVSKSVESFELICNHFILSHKLCLERQYILLDVTKSGNGELGTGNVGLGTSCQRYSP